MEEMWESMEGKTVWCGDFNAHSTVWGDKEESNGRIVESFMEEQGLVCLNDGTGTRIDVVRGSDSAIDLTIVSRALAHKCNWQVHTDSSSTPGRDRVCYSMLDHLSVESKRTLLHLYNKVWEEGVLPRCWKESIVVPIRKPGKDPRIPSSYRPIALTSQIGKTLERMVNNRMVFFLESKGLIHDYQSGFRKGRSTMDPIIALEDAVRRAQVNKESVAAVYFDIERAYDMLWKEGLLIKLSQLGVRGRIWAWVKAFLSERKITVRINGAFSNSYEVENGTPQGSIISPLLFTVMINEAFKEVDKSIDVALYADDGAM